MSSARTAAKRIAEEAVRRSLVLRALLYGRELLRARRASGSLLTDFPRWQASLRPHASALADEQPWLTYDAIGFLEQYLAPGMRIFEWGAGGSTLFLSRRASEGVSIEHDDAWATAVARRVDGRRWRVQCIPPAARPDPRYASQDPDHRARSFADYVQAIAACSDGTLDLVLVDGRARVACVRQALAKVKPGGVLVLDNSDRPEYAEALALLDGAGWRRQDFAGPAPYCFAFSRTTVWRRPAP
jgi:hypothetical protein